LKKSFHDDDDDDDDDNSEMGRSDILESLVPSDEDCETPSTTCTIDFHVVDLQDPTITIGMKFPNIQMFREVIRVYNVKKGKDIKFKRSEKMKCVYVYRYAKCKYKVYGKKMPDEESFQVKSI
jgi:hypothetical protein